MDLAELKQLESKIEKLKAEKQELLDKQHQIVVHHKYFKGKIEPVSFPPGKIHSISSINISGSAIYQNENGISSIANFSRDIPLQKAIDSGLVSINIQEDTSRYSKDYINMSEAISQIREEEKEKINNELKKALDRATNAEYEITVIEDKYKKKILESTDYYNKKIQELNSKYSEEIKNLAKIRDDKYKELKQEFEDYKEDKKRLSLEEQVKVLTKELQEYKNKTFWQRIIKK